MANPRSRLYIRRMLVALAVSQGVLLIALVSVVIQLHRTQKVPSPVINVSPTSNEANQVPKLMQVVSARVRTSQGSGSAVAISETLALTNWHVVRSTGVGNTVWVDTVDGSFVFEVALADEARDLAMLKSAAGYKFDHWAKLHSEKMEWGSRVFAVGCANSHLPLPSVGYWVRMMPNGLGQLSISCFWGSSGGGVFDAASGDLCGIIVQWDDPMEHCGVKSLPNVFHCIPIRIVNDFISMFNARVDGRGTKAEVVPLPPPLPSPSGPRSYFLPH